MEFDVAMGHYMAKKLLTKHKGAHMKSLSLTLIAVLLSANALAQLTPSQFGTLKATQNPNLIAIKRSDTKTSTPSNFGVKETLLNDLSQQKQEFLVRKILKEKGLLRGGGDAGGGNLLDGRPIENFAVNIGRTPEMIQALKIVKLIDSNFFESLDKITKSILERKTWYLIPVTLPDLSNDQIGTPFASTQGALQDFEEIWIDANRYDRMTSKEKVLLLVHEIFMGFKIFKHESFFRQCQLAEPFNTECMDFQPYVDRKKLTILPSDYQDVRKVVAKVSMNYEHFNSAPHYDELVRKISLLVFENGGFDSYFVKPSTSTITIKIFSGGNILNSIKNQASVKGFPAFCGHKIAEDLGNHKYRMRAMSVSKTDYSINGEKVQFDMQLKDIKTNKLLINNSYTFEVEKKKEIQLTLGYELNVPSYHYQSFVTVTSRTDNSQLFGMVSLGLTPSLNVRSLTFASLNVHNGQANLYDGKDVFKCLEKYEYICEGTNCVE